MKMERFLISMLSLINRLQKTNRLEQQSWDKFCRVYNAYGNRKGGEAIYTMESDYRIVG
jgi:hypothetical protein